jgi:pimeloyl-ACP methyl ester carboxylesterase
MSKLDIGSRELFYTCSGTGIPTVVIESGMGDTSESWSHIQSAVSQYTRVLTYDRAGMGQSDIPPRPRTCQDMVDDLTALLAGAQIPPPYILVGHSFGGLLVRLFASLHPEQTAGMVLVDASHEDRTEGFEKVLSNELIARNRAYLLDPAKNSEFVDRIPSEQQVKGAQRLFDFPLIVLTRGLPDEPDPVWPSAELQRVEFELQREFLKLSPMSSQVIAEQSGHEVQKDQPELVIESIKKMIGNK